MIPGGDRFGAGGQFGPGTAGGTGGNYFGESNQGFKRFQENSMGGGPGGIGLGAGGGGGGEEFRRGFNTAGGGGGGGCGSNMGGTGGRFNNSPIPQGSGFQQDPGYQTGENRFGGLERNQSPSKRDPRNQGDMDYKKGIVDLKSQIQMATEKVDPKALSPHHIYLTISGVIESGEVGFSAKYKKINKKRIIILKIIFLLNFKCRSEESLQIKFSITSGRDWEHIAVKQ